MIIDGLIKNSFIDYPEEISTVIFTSGCNLNCKYCHNHELIKGLNNHFDEEKIISTIKDKKEFIGGVVISGGEPTLQKDLKEFIIKIKKMGLKIKLDTNGSNPKIIEELLNEKLLDYLAIDIKTDRKNLDILGIDEVEAIKYIDNLEKTINILIEYGIDYEFRSTILSEEFHSIIEFIQMIKTIPDKKGIKYYLQPFRPKNTRKNKFTKKRRIADERLFKLKSLADNYFDHVETIIRN